MSKTCKKNPKCPYRERSKNAFPCTMCEEPNKQYPITCTNCRHYPCLKSEKSLIPCADFDWN